MENTVLEFPHWGFPIFPGPRAEAHGSECFKKLVWSNFLERNPIFWIFPAHTKSAETPEDPRKSMIVNRIVSFPGSEMVSGTILASAMSQLFYTLFGYEVYA